MPLENNTTLEYKVVKSWDGDDVVGCPEIHIKLRKSISSSPLEGGLVIQIEAPYFGDPPLPPEIPPGSTSNLWDYEVVEVFFLGEDNHYLEVELGPKGHYLLLELHGQRNMIRDHLPLEYFHTKIDKDKRRWEGEALIPFKYFPKNVNALNAYAIHKSDPERVYMSLFPVPKGAFSNPDFHRLDYFQKADFSGILYSC